MMDNVKMNGPCTTFSGRRFRGCQNLLVHAPSENEDDVMS